MNREILKLYAVTDRRCLRHCSFYDAVRDALEGGVSILQLRDKGLYGKSLLDEAGQIGKLCREYHVPFIVNDDVALAVAAGADGVHLGQGDGSPAEARRIAGRNFIIGVSAHNIEEALAAEEAGADYLGCGAVFATSTKNNTGKLELETLRHICNAVKIPVVAIGGITLENISALKGTGINGIAVASGIFGAEDISAAASNFLKEAEKLFL